MAITTRRLLGVLSLAFMPVLAGCPGDFSGGYEIVSERERRPLPPPAAPNPPTTVPAGTGGAAEVPSLPASAPAGVTEEMVAQGQRLYGTVCSACHGPGGAGTAAGPALNDASWIHIDGSYESIVSIIQTGVPQATQFPGMMPPLGGGNFSPDEVRAIGAYVFAISHAGA